MWLGGYNLRRLARLSELASADTRAREGAPLATQIVMDKTGDTRHEFDLADIPQNIVHRPAARSIVCFPFVGDHWGYFRGEPEQKAGALLSCRQHSFRSTKGGGASNFRRRPC